MGEREADLDEMPEPLGDPWDRAMHKLSDLELELFRGNAITGLLRGKPRAYQAGFKAAMEQVRREEYRALRASPTRDTGDGHEG
jgi:hypothetical protein